MCTQVCINSFNSYYQMLTQRNNSILINLKISFNLYK